MRIKLLLIGLASMALFFIYGFRTETPVLSPRQYVQWVENEKNGLRKIKKIKEASYTAQYKPTEYLVVKDLKKDHISSLEYTSAQSGIEESLQYFNFRIRMEDPQKRVLTHKVKSYSEEANRIAYMAFDMKNDFILLQGSDTLECKLFHHVRSYNLAPFTDFILAFEKGNKEGTHSRTLVYDDKLFGYGPIKLKFNKSDLSQLPTIKTY